MKKYIIIILLLFTINLNVFANTSDTISMIENGIFGFDYKNEDASKRIERLEKHLYGQKKSGNINSRLENIQNDIGFVVQKEQIQQTQQKTQTSKGNNKNIPDIVEDSTVEYPVVDSMEQEIFKTTYKKENIYNRLNRLEERVFNKTSNEDLNTRVDKLSSIIIPRNKRKMQQNDYDYSVEQMDSYYNNSGLDSISDQSIPFQLAALEQDLLHNAYANDNNSNRLSRLEQKLFKRTFSSDTDITRLQRIMVAYDAKKNSYKYENNRKMQNMATASQIGGILLMILAILL